MTLFGLLMMTPGMVVFFGLGCWGVWQGVKKLIRPGKETRGGAVMVLIGCAWLAIITWSGLSFLIPTWWAYLRGAIK